MKMNFSNTWPYIDHQWKKESDVSQLCPTLCDPVDCNPPGSSVHGIFQARVLEWVSISFSMSLLFNMLSRLVITFFPRSKHLLISWLQSPSAVILEPPKIKSDTVSTVSPSICYEVMGPDAMIFVFWMLSFKPTFSLSTFTFIKRLFSSSLSTIRVVSSVFLRLLIFLPAILKQLSTAQHTYWDRVRPTKSLSLTHSFDKLLLNA